MSRALSPWGTREVHSRVQWTTPVTSPVVPDFETTRAARRSLRWKRARTIGAAAVVIVGVALLLFGGCAHEPDRTTPIVLGEREGSIAAAAIEKATGQRPKAVTLPGYRPVVFSPKDAQDGALLAHERCHVEQQNRLGAEEWTAEYLRQLADCNDTQAACLRGIPLEAACYQVQHAWVEEKGAKKP